jgi:DNA-binding MarR family transcriptional regulator
MSIDLEQSTRAPMIRLLGQVFADFSEELYRGLAAAGFGDIRPGHGCVFGYIDPEGSRLTDMAERARMTKQSVGEVATDLERRGYLERIPDATDGRVKIIRLTDRGRAAQRAGRQLIDEIERDWAERYGESEIGALRATLEAIAARPAGV